MTDKDAARQRFIETVRKAIKDYEGDDAGLIMTAWRIPAKGDNQFLAFNNGTTKIAANDVLGFLHEITHSVMDSLDDLSRKRYFA